MLKSTKERYSKFRSQDLFCKTKSLKSSIRHYLWARFLFHVQAVHIQLARLICCQRSSVKRNLRYPVYSEVTKFTEEEEIKPSFKAQKPANGGSNRPYRFQCHLVQYRHNKNKVDWQSRYVTFQLRTEINPHRCRHCATMSHEIFLCSYYFSTLEAGLMEKCHVCPSRHKTVVKIRVQACKTTLATSRILSKAQNFSELHSL